MLRTAWIKPGALVVPYGTMSAVELDLTDIMSKIVVDDWGQCATGQFGALRAHVEAGKLTAQTLHAELGEIVAGRKPGRQSETETILFDSSGVALGDVAAAALVYERAVELGRGASIHLTD
jgi:ornithine cyclodeaminase